MSEGTLHPEAAPAESGGESAVDQIAGLLEEEGLTTSRDEETTTDEYEAESYDGDDDGDAETESPNQDDDDDDEFDGDDEEGLAALAHELGVDSDKLGIDKDGQIVVRVKVNGENKEVSLTEAIQGTQYRAANDQKAQELSEQRKTFDTERQAVAAEFTNRLQHIQGVGNMLEQKLMAEYNNTDWQALRVSDPAEFVARQHEFQQRNQELHQAGQAIGQQMRQQQENAERQWQYERAQILSSEREDMVSSVPEWRDEAVMKKDLGQLVEYGRSLGFADDDLSNVIHNRELQVLRKAWLYDQGQTVAEKKVQKSPKMQRASNGRFTSKKGGKVDRLVERAKTARGGEKREAEAAAILAVLGDS
jgi:hypothetical protein